MRTEDAPAPLNFKTDWRQLDEKGDYSFTEILDFPVLVMRCPFCDHEAPFPPVFLKIVKKIPLTLLGEIFCGYCDARFTIRDGVAYETQNK